MSINIDIKTKDFTKVKIFLNKMRLKALGKANRKALIGASRYMKTRVNREIRKYRALKTSEINRGYLKLIPPKQKDSIQDQNAGVRISGRKLSLIRFAVNKAPTSQRGSAIKDRAKVKVKIQKGRAKMLRKAFITKSSGATQVFMRKSSNQKTSLPIRRLALPSLASLISGKRKINKRIAAMGIVRYNREFRRLFNVELRKIGSV